MKQHTVMTACILLCVLAVVSEAHPRGGHGRTIINVFLRVLQRHGICDAYNAATEDERTTCSDEFVNDLQPSRGQSNRHGRSLVDIVDFICLEDGVMATSACEILDIACENGTTQASTLERCPRPQGNRQRRQESSDSEETSSEEEAEEEGAEVEGAEEEGAEVEGPEEGDGETVGQGAGAGTTAGGTTSAVTAAPVDTGTTAAATTPALPTAP